MLVSVMTSLLWPRFVVSIFILIMARFCRVVTRRKDARIFVWIGVVMLLRDAVALPLGAAEPGALPFVRVGGETVAYLLFLWWSGRFRSSNRSFYLSGAVGVALWSSLVVTALFGLDTRILATIVLYVVPLFLFIASFVAVVRVDRFVYARGYEIEELKPWLQVALMVQFLLYVFVPIGSRVFEPVVAVSAAGPLLGAPLYLVHLSVREERTRTRSLRANVGTIFSFLSRVGESLGGGRDPDVIVHNAIETMAAATDADGAAAVMFEGGRGRVVSAVGFFPPPVATPSIVNMKQGALHRFLFSIDVDYETPVWGRALRSGNAIHITDTSQVPELVSQSADRVLRLRSMLVLPLKVRGTVLGILSVVRRGDSRLFSTTEFDHARTMSDFVAVTLDNYFSYRLQRDVEIAGEIQTRLQAPPHVSAGGIEFAGVSRPARGVSGDYYDVIPLESDRTAVVICDVSGKGVPAALVMVMVRTIAHLALEKTDDAGEVLRLINRGVCGAISLDRFATAGVAVFDPNRERVSYANAGHHPALMIRSDRRVVEVLDADGIPIGIERDGAYPAKTVPFAPGDGLLLFTDGVIDALNARGDAFGERRLTETLLECWFPVEPTGHGGRTLERVVDRVDSFVGGAAQQDDLTMLVCAFGGPDARAGVVSGSDGS